MTTSRRFVALWALVAAAACSRGAPAARVRQATSPTLDIAALAADSGVVFSSATGGYRRNDGSIVVADSVDLVVRIFSATGRRIREVGGAGSEPGEFQSITYIAPLRGDSILVFDRLIGRATIFDSIGTVARTYRLPRASWRISANSAGEAAVLMSPVAATAVPTFDAPLLRSTVLLFSATGDTVARIDSVPAGYNRPMGPLTQIIRTATHVIVAPGDSATVAVFSETGARQGNWPLEIANRPMTAADYDAAIDSIYLAPMDTGITRSRVRAVVTAIPMPKNAPAYRRVLVDPNGAVWALSTWPLDKEEIWVGADGAGHPLGTIHLPAGVTVLSIDGTAVLGTRRDASNLPHLVLFRVE